MPNKAQFIELLAERLDGDKKRAQHALDAVIDTVYQSVAKGERVVLTGFGVFEKRDRAARIARNPATGASVKVKKTSVPAFRAGAEFKAITSGAKKLAKLPTKRAATAAKKVTAKAAPAKTTAKAPAKKAAPAKTATKAPARTAAKKTAPAKTAAKAPAKRTTAAKATPAKTTTRAAAKKTTATKAAPARSTATKAPAKKSAAKKAPAKRSR